MKLERVKLSDLHEPERNVRIHSEVQLREFERSIRMFGQIRPLVIDEVNTILAGNGCFLTLLRMGETEADAYRVSGLTEKQKKKLMIADNKIFDLGVDDLEAFNTFLEELSDDLNIPGFDQELLQSMVADADEVTKAISGYGSLTNDDISKMKEAEARRDAAIQNPVPIPPQEANREAVPSEIEREPVYGESEPPQAVDSRQFIVCPHCGETIWL